MAQYPQRPGEADNCRDFLRTGRCKYGESCKYHHPPNVQNGGGVRTPLDPSEPPFPIRPNEPPCQYYLKHGTCKFGQTCKFHHPPLSPKEQLTGLVAPNVHGSTSVASVLSSMDMILPQRPSEPDCIYFLRNGRCKYGATCKYHHPVLLDDCGALFNRVSAGQGVCGIRSRDRSQSTGSVSELGSVGALSGSTSAVGVNNGNAIPVCQFIGNQNQPTQHGATHIILNDGSIAIMVNPSHTLHASGGGVTGSYQNAPSGGPYYPNSASTSSPLMYSPVFSSVSSSYETTPSLDLLGRIHSTSVGSGGQADHVNRSVLDNGLPPLSLPRQSVGHANLSIPQQQLISPGGTNNCEKDFSPVSRRGVECVEMMRNTDGPLDSFGPPGGSGANLISPSNRSNLTRASISPSARIWDGRGPESGQLHGPGAGTGVGPGPIICGSETVSRNGYVNDSVVPPSPIQLAEHETIGVSGMHPSVSAPSLSGNRNPRQLWTGYDKTHETKGGRGSHDLDGNWEDGLSTMTSALLNMLDTPDEEGRVSSSQKDIFQPQLNISSPPRQSGSQGGMPPVHPGPVSGQIASRSQNSAFEGSFGVKSNVDFLPRTPGLAGLNSTSPPSITRMSPLWQNSSGQQAQQSSSVPTSPNVGLFLS